MFDSYFESFKEYGVLGSTFRNERGDGLRFELNTVSLPAFSPKGFKGVDSSPFGGGAGMIMRADVLKNALIEGVVIPGGYDEANIKSDLHIVCPSPRGKTWDQHKAKEFAQSYLSPDTDKDIVFICGRYEGMDERFLENYVDQFISVGDFILTGGEVATMIILDSAMRFSSGVLGNKISAVDESFANGQLEYALYTRPQEFEGEKVPQVLLNGNHKKIEEFKKESSLEITKKYRPELLE